MTSTARRPNDIHGKAPYFDFGYVGEQPPQQALAAVLARHPGSAIIDWSAGRLACIQTDDADLARLEQLIMDVASEMHGVSLCHVEACYENMLPA
jgi:hypothetical protein